MPPNQTKPVEITSLLWKRMQKKKSYNSVCNTLRIERCIMVYRVHLAMTKKKQKKINGKQTNISGILKTKVSCNILGT